MPENAKKVTDGARDLRAQIDDLVKHKDEPESEEQAPGESANDYIRRRTRQLAANESSTLETGPESNTI